jgi:membrane-associated protease RseP (regulator of RpoE activity)
VLKLAEARRRVVVLGSLAEGRDLEVAGWQDGQWARTRFDLNAALSTETDVEAELRGGFPEKVEGFPLDGGVLLDGEDRFLGFLTQVDRIGLSRSARAVRVLPGSAVRDSVRQVVDQGGSLQAGWLGVFIKDDSLRVEVQDVVKGSPADIAGLRPGDLILKLDGRNLWSRNQFVRLVRWLGPGTRADITVERAGQTLRLAPELASWQDSRPPAMAWAMEIPRVLESGGGVVETRNIRFFPVVLKDSEHFGLAVESITPQLARFFKVPGDRGLLVKSVLEQSLAGRIGFRAGDVLVSVNGTDVLSPTDLARVLQSTGDGVLEVRFVREGVVLTQRVVAP